MKKSGKYMTGATHNETSENLYFYEKVNGKETGKFLEYSFDNVLKSRSMKSLKSRRKNKASKLDSLGR